MEDYGNDRYEVRVEGTGRVMYLEEQTFPPSL